MNRFLISVKIEMNWKVDDEHWKKILSTNCTNGESWYKTTQIHTYFFFLGNKALSTIMVGFLAKLDDDILWETNTCLYWDLFDEVS